MILTGLGIGILFGAVLQRGRFCVTGMLRDIYMNKSWRGFSALMVLIAVHSLGLTLLTSLGVLAPEVDNFAPAAVMVGGFVFGLGIILAGGCASGTWYRSAEGLVGSWFALITYGLSAAAMKYGPLSGLNSGLREWTLPVTTIHDALGISPWILVAIVWIIAIAMVRHFLIKDAGRPDLNAGLPWYQRPLNMQVAGALVGVIGTVGFVLSAASGRNSGLGITTPTGNLVAFAATGNADKYLDWGVMLVLGVLVGAFVAAKAAGEFRVRVPDPQTIIRAIWGGVLMGIGAAWAGGCTVGNGMVETSLFSFQGWIALLFIAFGVFAGAKLWLKPASRPAVPATSAAPAADTVNAAPVGNLGISSATGLVNVQPSGGVAVATRPEVTDSGLRVLGEGRYALDTLGAVCPFPLIEAKRAIATLNPGDALVIDFDCTQATDSIPAWAADDGHTITDFQRKDDAGWQVTVVKG